MMTERQRDLLREVWKHQQVSLGEPVWSGGVHTHLRKWRRDLDETIGDSITHILADFERLGYIEKTGRRLTPAGSRSTRSRKRA